MSDSNFDDNVDNDKLDNEVKVQTDEEEEDSDGQDGRKTQLDRQVWINFFRFSVEVLSFIAHSSFMARTLLMKFWYKFLQPLSG